MAFCSSALEVALPLKYYTCWGAKATSTSLWKMLNPSVTIRPRPPLRRATIFFHSKRRRGSKTSWKLRIFPLFLLCKCSNSQACFPYHFFGQKKKREFFSFLGILMEQTDEYHIPPIGIEYPIRGLYFNKTEFASDSTVLKFYLMKLRVQLESEFN